MLAQRGNAARLPVRNPSLAPVTLGLTWLTGATELRGHDGQVQQGEQEVHVPVSVGQTSGATQVASILGSARELGFRDAQATHTRGDSFVRRCRFVQAARTVSGNPVAMRLGSLSGQFGTLRVRPAPLMWRHG